MTLATVSSGLTRTVKEKDCELIPLGTNGAVELPTALAGEMQAGYNGPVGL